MRRLEIRYFSMRERGNHALLTYCGKLFILTICWARLNVAEINACDAMIYGGKRRERDYNIVNINSRWLR
jgi:hypothetical protein